MHGGWTCHSASFPEYSVSRPSLLIIHISHVAVQYSGHQDRQRRLIERLDRSQEDEHNGSGSQYSHVVVPCLRSPFNSRRRLSQSGKCHGGVCRWNWRRISRQRQEQRHRRGRHHGIAVAGLPTDICIHPLSNVYMQTRIYICKLPIDSVTDVYPLNPL